MSKSLVFLHVYDLSGGMAKRVSETLMGKHLEGIYHTGIVAFGREYFYGAGICAARPGRTHFGRPIDIIELGTTQSTKDAFTDFLSGIGGRYRQADYHLLEHNCNNFTSEASQFLTGHDIPKYITNLPGDFLSTPLGAMLQPIIEQMMGGGAVAPPGSGGEFLPHPDTGSDLSLTTAEWDPIVVSDIDLHRTLGKVSETLILSPKAGESLPTQFAAFKAHLLGTTPPAAVESTTGGGPPATDFPDTRPAGDTGGPPSSAVQTSSTTTSGEPASGGEVESTGPVSTALAEKYAMLEDLLLRLSVADLFPVVDLLRFLVLNEDDALYLTTAAGQPFLGIVRLISTRDTSDAARTMLLRLIGNMFVHESTRPYMTSPACVSTCIDIILAGLASVSVPVRLAAASAAFNYSLVFSPEHQGAAFQFANAISQAVLVESHDETALRMLVALAKVLNSHFEVLEFVRTSGFTVPKKWLVSKNENVARIASEVRFVVGVGASGFIEPPPMANMDLPPQGRFSDDDGFDVVGLDFPPSLMNGGLDPVMMQGGQPGGGHYGPGGMADDDVELELALALSMQDAQ